MNSSPRFHIRCATTPEGHIEACAYLDLARRVVVHRQTRNVIESTVQEGSDDFRRLVRAARVHCSL
jgi:hypothetical protein